MYLLFKFYVYFIKLTVGFLSAGFRFCVFKSYVNMSFNELHDEE